LAELFITKRKPHLVSIVNQAHRHRTRKCVGLLPTDHAAVRLTFDLLSW